MLWLSAEQHETALIGAYMRGVGGDFSCLINRHLEICSITSSEC
jgi:hypothetical protein